jgi:hypothetical protein
MINRSLTASIYIRTRAVHEGRGSGPWDFMRPNMVRVRDLFRALLGSWWSVEERPRSVVGFFFASFGGSSLYLDL